MTRLAANPEGIRYEEQRRFAIPLADAWRLLADTDHLNRAIGLPAVDFSPLEGGELVRKARARAYGIVPLRWREFPFDWVRERRYAVRREFESGPLDWVVCGIELQPNGEEETTLTSWARFRPRNAAGRVLWRLGRAPVHALLEFCERYLERQAEGKADPVPVPKGRPKVDRALLDKLLEQVSAAPDLRDALRERVLEGSDDQVAKVRPYALAAVWGRDRLELLELFLHSARAGLFEPRWQLMCPNCRIPKSEVGGLADLPPQFHCDTCGIVYTVDVERHLELRFTVAPAVRATEEEIYCIGGPLRMPHVVAQQYLAPHEDRSLELALAEPLQLRTIGGVEHLDLVAGPPSRTADVKLTYTAGRWTGPHSLEAEGRLSVPEGAALTLRNQTDGFVLALVETTGRTRDATTLADVERLEGFEDVLDPDAIARAAGR
jgi:hypothetical protein